MTTLKLKPNEVTTRARGEDRTHQRITASSGLSNQPTSPTVTKIEYTDKIRDNVKDTSVTIKKYGPDTT